MWYFILGVIVAWLVFSHLSKKTRPRNSGEGVLNLNKDIDKERIHERQQRFEDFMVYSLAPTALYADRRKTYFHMKSWFIRIDERNSHDHEKQQQIRKDWLAYMNLLDQGATSQYLWLETDDDESSRAHGNDAQEAMIRVGEIENRFASMIGTEAQTILKEIRDKNFESLMDEQSAWEEQLLLEYKKKEEKKSGNETD